MRNERTDFEPEAARNPSAWKSIEDVIVWADRQEAIGALYIATDLRRVAHIMRRELDEARRGTTP